MSGDPENPEADQPRRGPGATARPPRRPPRQPRRQPAGQVLVIMVVGLAIAGIINADAIARSSNAQHADSWRADVAGVAADISNALRLTFPRNQLDTALGRGNDDTDVDDLLAEAGAEQADAPDSPTTTVPQPPEIRTPTAEDPLRLWVGGDSMASEFSKSMANVADDTGVMQATLDPRVSTGLARPDYFNWPAHLVNEVLPTDDPDALVIMFGANDAQGMELDDGTVLERFSDPWLEEYRRRVAGTMDLLRSPENDRITFWLGMPIMRPDAGVRGQDLLNHIYWSEAQSRPWIVFVDSWPFFANASGQYQHDLPSEDGTTKGMRQPDGVHWSTWGANRIAWEVLEVMGEHIDLDNSVAEFPPDEIAPADIEPRDEVPPGNET